MPERHADAIDFGAARRETVRYHEELYSSVSLGQAGTWLARPHRLLRESLALLRAERSVVAYDLGAGIGRHTLPLLRDLPVGSEVYAVDLLPSALEKLKAGVPATLLGALHVRAADLDDYEFETAADLVVAFSALEHLPSAEAAGRAMERIRSAIEPGGVVAIGLVTDRVEVDEGGHCRPARIESAMTSGEALGLLQQTFHGYTCVSQDSVSASVREERAGATYTLASTLVTWLGSAPAHRP